MTQPQQNPQPAQPAQQPAQQSGRTRQSGEQPATVQTGAQPASSADDSGTFGDGSTQAQQDQLVKEAEEANQQVKELADGERKAREDSSS